MDLISIKDSIITVDAGTAKKQVTDKIDEKGGAYLIPIKGNQKLYQEKLKKCFKSFAKKNSKSRKVLSLSEKEKGHGRYEERYLTILKQDKIPKELFEHKKDPEYWRNLKTVARITRVRKTKIKQKYVQERQSDGSIRYNETDEKYKTSTSNVFYISNASMSPNELMEKIRAHWEIEGNLHYHLDVTFKEDSMKVRTKKLAENFSLLRKMAFNLVKKNKSIKGSLNIKLKSAGWSIDSLEKILLGI